MNKIFVTRPSLPPLEEFVNEISSIWECKILTNTGTKHEQLEGRLADFLNVEQISLFTNGHSALELSIEALKLTGEVITTPFSFASTTHAICRNQLIPVFCDIRPDDFTIDVDQIEALITPKTSAIIPVHVYGHVCDIEGLERIARKYKLKLIFDAAHAFGESVNGQTIGRFGDISIFSFHATKAFNTIEGGAATSTCPEIKRNLDLLKNFGITSETDVELIGSNAKMNEFQAAMGLCNLKYYEQETLKRKSIIERYHEILNGIQGLCFPRLRTDVKSNYSYMPLMIDSHLPIEIRDIVYQALRSNGIFARRYFYPLISDYRCYQNMGFNNNTPIARSVADHIITLPVYADLEQNDVDRICQVVIDNLPQ